MTASRPSESGSTETLIESRGLNAYYGAEQALKDVDIAIPGQQVTAIIGPSGCGKSTLLRCINHMNDLVEAARVEGDLLLGETNLYDDSVDPVVLRRRIGMVFNIPTPSRRASTTTSSTGCESKASPSPTRLFGPRLSMQPFGTK